MKGLLGTRILKTGIAVGLSIAFTNLIGITSTFPGVVSLIAMKESTKQTLRYGWTIFIGSIITILIGIALGMIPVAHSLLFGLGTILSISIIVLLQITDGLVLAVVVMYHVIDRMPIPKTELLPFLTEEFILVFIGLVFTTLVNLARPQKYDQFLSEKIQFYYKKMHDKLMDISKQVQQPNDHAVVTDLSAFRKEMKTLIAKAEIGKENMFSWMGKKEYDLFIKKINILRELIRTLEDMEHEVSRIKKVQIHSGSIGNALVMLASIQNEPESTSLTKYQSMSDLLRELEEHYKNSKLPESRADFEDRSILYHLFLLMKDYTDQLFLLHEKV